MVESNGQKYIGLNALTSERSKTFEGPVTIKFDNGREHNFALVNTQISRIDGEDVSQGLFNALFTTNSSMSTSNMETISLKFRGEKRRTYPVRHNPRVLRQQYPCIAD